MRTLLVVSATPHPWAMLRDRLDPELVAVAWAPPDAAPAPSGPPWLIAGSGAELPRGLGADGRLVGCCWVGPPPPGLPARPASCADWRGLAAEVQRRLAVRVAGVRLAPGAGLALAGRYLSGVGELEALLAAHPEGIELDARRARIAAARVRRVLSRHRLPLTLVRRGSRLALVTHVGAA